MKKIIIIGATSEIGRGLAEQLPKERKLFIYQNDGDT